MKRVNALGLVCLVMFFGQGCAAHRTRVMHPHGVVVQRSQPHNTRHYNQAPRPLDQESERIRIQRMQAVTDALWATAAVARVALEIVRVVR